MKIRLVRHATLVIELDDRTLLIDPMLGDVGEFMSFLNYSCKQLNPIVPLPDRLDLTQILSSVKATFVTHTHSDHFDQAAAEKLAQAGAEKLPEDFPIFCQPPGEGQPPDKSDEEKLREFGFSSVQPVEDNLQYDGIEIFRTSGQHGPDNKGSREENMGPVSGFVLRSQSEPTLYIAGDTIYCKEVEDTLHKYQPDIVVVNAGAAQLHAEGPAITMTKEHVRDVCRYVCKHMPSATVVAVHMDAIDHCLLHRKELENYIESKGLSERVSVPADGESMEF